MPFVDRYPPNDVLRGPFALDEWRADVVADYLLLGHAAAVLLGADIFEWW